MRTFTQDGLKSLLAETTEQVFLFAMKITHADLASPYFVVQNNVDLDIETPDDGVQTFTAYAFEFSLPAVEEDSLPKAQVNIDNVDDFLIDLLRTTDVAPEFYVYAIRKDPNSPYAVTEMSNLNFTLKSVNWDIQTINGDLTLDYDYLHEPCMKFRFTPEIAVGLFDYSYGGEGSFIREIQPVSWVPVT